MDVLAGERIEPGEGDALLLVRPLHAGLAEIVQDHRQEVAGLVSQTRKRGIVFALFLTLPLTLSRASG